LEAGASVRAAAAWTATFAVGARLPVCLAFAWGFGWPFGWAAVTTRFGLGAVFFKTRSFVADDFRFDAPREAVLRGAALRAATLRAATLRAGLGFLALLPLALVFFEAIKRS